VLTALAPRNLFGAALDLEVESADRLAAGARSHRDRLIWAEHANRLYVFRLFQYADELVGHVRRARLDDVIAGTQHLAAFDRLWLTEGVGYVRGEVAPDAGTVPQTALFPLHAGIGLAIATRWLRRASVDSLGTIVDGAVADCHRVSLPGFERVAFEGIGLAVRTLAPHLTPAIDAALAERDPILRACFWHGIGRGTYFAISNWQTFGSSPERAAASLRWQATDDRAEHNAIAGLTFAVTLVNLLAPEILERWVGALAGGFDAGALRNGIESSLIVWQHSAPGDGSLDRVLALAAGLSASPSQWDGIAVRAAESALVRYRQLVAAGRLQDVFHYGAA